MSLHRVKLYRLNGDGSWADKGTGFVTLEKDENTNKIALVVISEHNTKSLFAHDISNEVDIYKVQGDGTIITWTDKDEETDIALSFQEASGCAAIMGQIQGIKHQQGLSDEEAEARHRIVDEFEERLSYQSDSAVSDSVGTSGMHMSLPPPETRNLEHIEKIINYPTTPAMKENLAQQVLREKYWRGLLELFRTCEDLEDLPCLHLLYKVVKGLIMLNDPELLEELLSEEHCMDTVGALEYDPDLKGCSRPRHREFLQGRVVFKEVVPIKDPKVLAKIHQTYRIQYLKDVVLPRSLDESTYQSLLSVTVFNNMDIVTSLHQDVTFLHALAHNLRTLQPSTQAGRDLVAFLQEMCSLARSFTAVVRQQIWNKLVQIGLFDMVTRIMQQGDGALKLRAVDILLASLQHDPSPLRKFLMVQKDRVLFRLLVAELAGVAGGSGPAPATITATTPSSAGPSNSGGGAGGRRQWAQGLPEQVAELLKSLLDCETMEQQVEKSDFLACFYDNYMMQLVDALVPNKVSVPSGPPPVWAKKEERRGEGKGPQQQQHGGVAAEAPAGSSSKEGSGSRPQPQGNAGVGWGLNALPPGPNGEASKAPPDAEASVAAAAGGAEQSAAGGMGSSAQEEAGVKVEGASSTGQGAADVEESGAGVDVKGGEGRGEGWGEQKPKGRGGAVKPEAEPAVKAEPQAAGEVGAAATAESQAERQPVADAGTAGKLESQAEGQPVADAAAAAKAEPQAEGQAGADAGAAGTSAGSDRQRGQVATPGPASTSGGSAAESTEAPASVLGCVVELLCFCVTQHTYQIKYYVLRHKVMEKVQLLLRRRERWLVLAAVRFLRTCVGLKDEFYNRYLIRNNLFEPVMEAFFANGRRYNLLNSAVLDLMEFIRKEGIKSLLVYVVETFGKRFDEVDYVDTFKQMKTRYEQAHESRPPGNYPDAAGLPDRPTSPVGRLGEREGRFMIMIPETRLRRDTRALDRDEEDYFSEDADGSDDDDVRSSSPDRAGGRGAPGPLFGGAGGQQQQSPGQILRALVDYDDDDDEVEGQQPSSPPPVDPALKGRKLQVPPDSPRVLKRPRAIGPERPTSPPQPHPQKQQPTAVYDR